MDLFDKELQLGCKIVSWDRSFEDLVFELTEEDYGFMTMMLEKHRTNDLNFRIMTAYLYLMSFYFNQLTYNLSQSEQTKLLPLMKDAQWTILH